MKITILTQEYAPEEVSSGVLLQELAEDLASRGHDVTVVTRAPNYPLGRVFDGYRNKIYQSEYLNSVRVIRVWSYITSKRGFWHRILSFGTYSACAIYGALLAGRPDILVIYSPPLPLGVSAWIVSTLFNIPWVLRVEDLYPEAAVAAGVMTNARVIRFFDKLAFFLYARATHISLITEGFRRNLLKKGVPDSKMSVTPVWADPDFVHAQSKENNFRSKHGLAGKFVVMYAGALGLTSALEDVMDAAKILKEEPTVRFVIVGEGVKKAWLEEFIVMNDLNNVLLLPFQPRADFPDMMAAADLNLVTLNDAFAEFSLPHKIYNIMASERTILAVAPLHSDLAILVEQNKCGVVLPPQKPSALAEAILKLVSQPESLTEMGRNGRTLLLNNYARKICIDTYEQLFDKMSQKLTPGNTET